MVIHRINASTPAATGDACYEAMQRHHDNGRQGRVVRVPIATPLPMPANGGQGGGVCGSPPSPPGNRPQPGDIIYGARAIARFLFDDESNRARRRVFNIWTHYRDRKEDAGLFKLKGALCLSMSKWQAFHGL